MKDISDNDPLQITIQRQLENIDKILSEVIHASSISIIREAAHHIIFSGGKRFRPALAVLSARLCGYSGDVVAYVGAAIELIHTASLIHDDVLDGADLRRGVASANVKWGNHISILVGDYCLSRASELLLKHTSKEVIAILTDAIIKTTEGEVLEILHSNDVSINEETYIQIVKLKTAHLIASSCKAGSIVAEAPPMLISALLEYGMNLGIAYQIIDDVLDYTIEDKHLGKRKGIDLKEGKLTLPVIYALNICSRSEKETIIESLLTSNFSIERLGTVISILDKHNCIQEAQKTSEKYLKAAVDALSQFKPSLEKEALIKYAYFVANRKN